MTATDPNSPLIDAIDALLPQTQCQRCDHAGCRPYAEAIAAGEPINRCPPGGDATINALASLLDRPVLPLDTRHGERGPRDVAYIREAECIGCTKCIQACPTDAILGAAQQMHTVMESECTGCGLCVSPCPVDCIDMRVPADGTTAITAVQSRYWRQRYTQRAQRLARLDDERRERQRQRLLAREARQKQTSPAATMKSRAELQEDIRAAVARAKARRATAGSAGSR